ncbi:MAG: copper resistance protein CopC [Actinomycetota bacterium]|nr:copper resistance protein CopC [Actinomycetota bacterium]
MVKRLVTGLAALAFAALSAVAYAHGDVRSTSPKADAIVESPPKRVTVTLTEAPSRDAVVRAKDGCGKQVITTVSVAHATITGAVTDGAQPGRWAVSWRAISTVDGHPTEGKFAFTVDGVTDCSAEGGPSPSPEPTEDATVAPETPEPTITPQPSPTESEVDLDAAPASDEDGGGFPTVPVAVGAAAIVAVALIARFAGAR